MAGRKRNREVFPEIGGIVHLEHFNHEVVDHEAATTFYIHGLGFTRDPYQRTDTTNMGVNIGLEQFHLPRTGRETPPFHGEIGIVHPDLAFVRDRLARIEGEGKLAGTKYALLEDGANEILVRGPHGIHIRLIRGGTVPFAQPIGIARVDIPVAAGKVAGIADFFRGVMGAPVEETTVEGETAAVVTYGPFQTVRFRERKMEDYDLYRFHLAYYVTGYNAVRARVIELGLAEPEDGARQTLFFPKIFDVKSGEPVLDFIQEIRSLHHPDFMRPYTNRWPGVADQTVLPADALDRVAKLAGH
jgi:hypothetical protein